MDMELKGGNGGLLRFRLGGRVGSVVQMVICR